jgi:hypothetical protein
MIIIHLVCLTTSPKPLPKRALQIVRCRAFSFRCEYPLLYVRSFSNFLRLLPRLPVISIRPFIFPSIPYRRRNFLRKMWPVQLLVKIALRPSHCKYRISLFYVSILHTGLSVMVPSCNSFWKILVFANKELRAVVIIHLITLLFWYRVISVTPPSKNEELSHTVNKVRNIIYIIKQRKVKSIDQILRCNGILKCFFFKERENGKQERRKKREMT